MPPWYQWPNLDCDWLVQVKGTAPARYQKSRIGMCFSIWLIVACHGQSYLLFCSKEELNLGVKRTGSFLETTGRKERTSLFGWWPTSLLAASHQVPPGLHMLRFPFLRQLGFAAIICRSQSQVVSLSSVPVFSVIFMW